jgi:hypothetical protein
MTEAQTRKAFFEEEIPINPPLPEYFNSTPNEERPDWQIEVLWNRPFIVTTAFFSNEKFREDWYKNWPSGIRYDARCLDGGAWDRSTCWGMYPTLEEAIECCKNGPMW